MGWSELVDYIRENFEKKYAENIQRGDYDPRDVERLQNDFKFARTFVRGRERLEEGVDLVHTAFLFRKEYKVNDLTEASFAREIMELGGLYFRNRDVEANRILWLRVHKHRKDAPADHLKMEKLGFAFSLEKAFREDPLKPIVVCLDMTNCGLANMDIDFVKYVITCFKFYYPTFLAYMLIFDMPWIFNAAWKIIKTWLSHEAASRIKFVTKANIQTYIKPEMLPEHMGGTDDFEFHYEPGMFSDPLYPEDEKDSNEKKVNFEADEKMSSEAAPPPLASPVVSEASFQSTDDISVASSSSNTSNTSTVNTSSVNTSNKNNNDLLLRSVSEHNSNNNSHEKRSSFARKVQRSNSVSTFVGRFLSVSPADELTFHIDESGDAFDVITLSNTLTYNVAFKVKTTSPEKYRVRPSSGFVKPGKTEEVYVYLIDEHKNSSTSKDKFLIMAVEVTDKGTEDIAKVWKEAPKDGIMEHKLTCRADVKKVEVLETGDTKLKCISSSKKLNKSPTASANPLISNGSASNLEDKISLLVEQNEHMSRQLKLLFSVQIATVIFFLIIMFSYSCFGEDVFTRFLVAPFDVCSNPCSNRY